MKSDGTVLVTGTASGIGRAIAERLARAGYTVYGTSRSLGSQTVSVGFTMLPLDVTSEESVAACVGEVLARSPRLDALVNNAGYGLFGAAEETALDEARAQLETNFFGVVRLVNAVLPTMRAQGAGRIVNISSVLGTIGLPFGSFYCASKWALEAYSEALREEVRPFGIAVSLVEPGFVRTAFAQNTRLASRELDVYAARRRRVIDFGFRGVEEGIPPERVAALVFRVLKSRGPRLRYRVGRDSRMLAASKALLPYAWFESVSRKTLGLT